MEDQNTPSVFERHVDGLDYAKHNIDMFKQAADEASESVVVVPFSRSKVYEQESIYQISEEVDTRKRYNKSPKEMLKFFRGRMDKLREENSAFDSYKKRLRGLRLKSGIKGIKKFEQVEKQIAMLRDATTEGQPSESLVQNIVRTRKFKNVIKNSPDNLMLQLQIHPQKEGYSSVKSSIKLGYRNLKNRLDRILKSVGVINQNYEPIFIAVRNISTPPFYLQIPLT